MRPLERKANTLELICELIELPRLKISAGFLGPYGDAAGRLIEIGLLRSGTAPGTIACRACDEDHAATAEFDCVAGRYFHFCPVAGRVAIDPRDLETLEIRPRALVDLLLAAFPVLPAIGQELVTGKVWHLGEAVIGRTSLTLVFARRITSQQNLGTLARAAAVVPVTELGLIITTSSRPLDGVIKLPHDYKVVSLRDIAGVHGGRLEIDHVRLGAYVKAARGKHGGVRAGERRPSCMELVEDAYAQRRQRGQPFVSFRAEAREIASEMQQARPDRAPPGNSTIRKHLRTLLSPKF